MRKLKQLVVVLMAVLLVSGCKMKAEYNMAIKKDKSMDLSVIIGMDDELLNLMLASEENNGDFTGSNANYTDEQKWAYLDKSLEMDDLKGDKDEDVTIDKYTEDGFKGYKVVFKVKNIDEISGSKGSDTINDLSNIDDKELFVKNGNKYSLKFTIDDMKEVTEQAESSSTEGLNMDMSSIFDLKFVISLPDKPIKHNATSVSDDGKTLTWDLMKQGDTPIEVEFELAGKSNTLFLYIGIGVAVLIVVIILVVALSGKKKKGQAEMTGFAPVPPVGPQGVNPVGAPVPPVPPVEPPRPENVPGAPVPPVPPVPPVEPAPMPPTPPVPPVEPPKPETTPEAPVPPVPPVDAPVEPPVPPVEPTAPVPEEVASPVEVPEEPKPEVNE